MPELAGTKLKFWVNFEDLAMSKEVKILYCNDANGDVEFYQACQKEQKYSCLECGEQLILRDGSIKIKHLAHKTDTQCKSTGERILWQKWIQSLVVPGMKIQINDSEFEIHSVENNVNVGERYGVELEKPLIADLLLITSDGDIPVMIHRKSSPIKWNEIMPYYDAVYNLIADGFEVSVGKYINHGTTWKTFSEIRDQLEQNTIRKKSLELASFKSAMDKWKRFSESKKLNCYFNYSSKPKRINQNVVWVPCAVETSDRKHSAAVLQLDTRDKYTSYSRLMKNLSIKKGIWMNNFVVTGTLNDCPVLSVKSFFDVKEYDAQSNYLYRTICTAPDTMDGLLSKAEVISASMENSFPCPEWNEDTSFGYTIPDNIRNKNINTAS